jgi:quinol monooxygenase YgiN
MPQEKMPQVSDKELMMNNTLTIKPEYREEYLRELREILPQARRLEACISLEVGEVADQPGTFVLSERWRNGNEYLNEILQLPFYQRYLERSEPFYAAPRAVLVLMSVS